MVYFKAIQLFFEKEHEWTGILIEPSLKGSYNDYLFIDDTGEL